MRILISNDDGCQSPGLGALDRALRDLGEVAVMAPDRDRSGAGYSLTLTVPIRAQRNGYASVTPLQVDRTRRNALKSLAQWLDRCG